MEDGIDPLSLGGRPSMFPLHRSAIYVSIATKILNLQYYRGTWNLMAPLRG